MLIAVKIIPVETSHVAPGAVPKTMGNGPMKITTAPLAEPPFIIEAAITTAMPTDTRTKPIRNNAKTQLGKVSSSSLFPFCSLGSLDKSDHLSRK